MSLSPPPSLHPLLLVRDFPLLHVVVGTVSGEPRRKAKRKRGREAKFASLSAHSARSSRRLLKPNLPSAAANSHESVSTRGGRPRTGAEGVRWRPNEHRPQREQGGASRLAASDEQQRVEEEEKKGRNPAAQHHPTSRTSSPGWARTLLARTSRRHPFRAWSRAGQ